MRPNPVHVEGKGDKQESDNRQPDAQGQEGDRATRIVTVLDQADHAGREAGDDQEKQDDDDRFDESHEG